MRRVTRPALAVAAQRYLGKRQAAVNRHRAEGTLDIEREWNSARQTQTMRAVLKTLQQACGSRERCMYCVDSHGSDIDHFRPKKRYPARAFQWSNLLLCCAECGRFKGSQFPLQDGRPLLIDPCAEDPWAYVDFDPDTGNLTARFDLVANDWSAKGIQTVGVLQLDKREALAAGYLTTYRRLVRLIQESLGLSDAHTQLPHQLLEADDHGLLSWCFKGAGQEMPPFRELRVQYPQTWAACLNVAL